MRSLTFKVGGDWDSTHAAAGEKHDWLQVGGLWAELALICPRRQMFNIGNFNEMLGQTEGSTGSR